MDPDANYDAVPIRCHACEAIELEKRAFVDGSGETAGLVMAVEQVRRADG
jgi:hypothetical protein